MSRISTGPYLEQVRLLNGSQSILESKFCLQSGAVLTQRLGLRTFDQAVVGLIPGRGVILSPRST